MTLAQRQSGRGHCPGQVRPYRPTAKLCSCLRTQRHRIRCPHAMSPLHRLALLCLMLFLTQQAHAYIDPNAGGLLFQLLAPLFAGIVGAWLVARRWVAAQCRRWWRRITGRPEV